MSLADMTSARSSPGPDTCPECDTSASVTSDLHKYQVACTCKPSSPQYACADEPGPPVSKSGDIPPALPPRPTVALAGTNRRNNAALPNASGAAPATEGVLSCARRRKYAWWCVGCGALAAALGGLLAAAHILLRAYTASPHHLETVPAAVPAAMLVLTGVCIMSLARRRNRYSYMIKVVGACCLVCALTCVLVTITTTVIHMNKLQTLKFCEYTRLTRTCTCFSLPPDSHHSSDEDEGVRCVFEGVTDCGVVHGVLYWCLRGVFALSVTAVLVCIFSSMLAYQLLSHERKKMYWEQLELRCRSLYRPPSGARARPVQPPCACCQQCHPAQPAWDISLQHRFWAPGRVGNLYSPNPGTMRKNSAWSWFPWPRTNSQRCRMGAVPQSGDSAYGFCDTSGENPTQTSSNPNPTTPYEDRPSFPTGYNENNQNFNQNTLPFTNNAFNRAMSQSVANFTQSIGQSGAFGQSSSAFAQTAANFGQTSANFVQSSANFGQSSGAFGQGTAGYGQEGQFAEAGSFDGQTGVWGPPPPYSPQGRGGIRHHQDPATATLLHHHIEMHRSSVPLHHDLGSNLAVQHTCNNRNSSYAGHLIHPNAALLADINQVAPELARLNPDMVRLNPESVRFNPELAHLNPELAHLNPEMARLNPELARMNPEMARVNPELARLNAEMSLGASEMAFGPNIVHLGSEMARLGSERCNTLRGHLVPYNACHRMIGVSMGNLHRECGEEILQCVHQKVNSKVSDQGTEPASKQGKENLAFQNDKHSPVRASLQLECRGNAHAESEVYFADVSSCCNISIDADCCGNPNVSALVGTIENHPESTSGESDNGSFTLTRSQRPQPQTLGSKRRPRLPPSIKDINNSIRSIGDRRNCHELNSSIRSIGQNDSKLGQSDPRMCQNDPRMCQNDSKHGQNDFRHAQNDRYDLRQCDLRSLDDLNASMCGHDLNNSLRHDILTTRRQSEHSSPIRMCGQSDHSPMHSIHHERRTSDQNSNSSLIEEARNAGSPKIITNLAGLRWRHGSSSQSDPRGQSDRRFGQNDPRAGQSDSRNSQCDQKVHNDPSELRGLNDSRISQKDSRMSHNDSRLSQNGGTHSPKHDTSLHPRQSSSDSTISNKNPEFFVPPPPSHSPVLTPGTEESSISDEEMGRATEVFKKETLGPEVFKKEMIGPDSQYEQGEKELKPNHLHCYSDTNTMDSGWQSGSEKHVTD